MNYFLALLGAGVIGVCVALEPTVNSGLGKIIGPKLATFHSLLVGLVAILVISLFNLGGFKDYKMIAKAPPYLWIGGLLGITIVYLGTRVPTVIGVASTVTVMVAVQMVTSIVIDSLGLFGATKVPVDSARIIGVILIIVAVKLIVR
ncbi:MAG: DMT family transporter [Clostridia bacterium]|nr:DMT family transporter [Clostridia bacterium]